MNKLHNNKNVYNYIHNCCHTPKILKATYLTIRCVTVHVQSTYAGYIIRCNHSIILVKFVSQ